MKFCLSARTFGATVGGALMSFALAMAVGACDVRAPINVQPIDDDDEEPHWRFNIIEHPAGEVTWNGVWARPDNTIFAVGAHGEILTNRERRPDGSWIWRTMEVPSQAHLTAIIGLGNGELFGLDALDGELFAVGWHGTLLHYHPNPDGDPETDDGQWTLVAGRSGLLADAADPAFLPLIRADPACPDYDGDGIADDGDGSGFWGDNPCVSGHLLHCDDNCRTSANGPQRPLSDINGDGCLGPGDGPNPDATQYQRDDDGDGVGRVCDLDDDNPSPARRYVGALFDVWAEADGDQITVVAVGEGGALITYQGASAGAVVASGEPVMVQQAAAWLAQEGVAFRYDDDCPIGTPAGTLCAGAVRLPPSCPAQCNPIKTTCNCPVGQNQCCDVNASTGVGCVDGSCPPATNACAANGACSSSCPSCFRRLTTTLRSVSRVGDELLLVGAQGVILAGSVHDPSGVYGHPSCIPTPKPLDERPVLTSIRGHGAAAFMVGASGSIVGYFPGAGCSLAPRLGAPPAFLSAVALGPGGDFFAVGDRGVFLHVLGSTAAEMQLIPTKLTHNFYGVVVVPLPVHDAVWMVGSGGVIMRAQYF